MEFSSKKKTEQRPMPSQMVKQYRGCLLHWRNGDVDGSLDAKPFGTFASRKAARSGQLHELPVQQPRCCHTARTSAREEKETRTLLLTLPLAQASFCACTLRSTSIPGASPSKNCAPSAIIALRTVALASAAPPRAFSPYSCLAALSEWPLVQSVENNHQFRAAVPRLAVSPGQFVPLAHFLDWEVQDPRGQVYQLPMFLFLHRCPDQTSVFRGMSCLSSLFTQSTLHRFPRGAVVLTRLVL